MQYCNPENCSILQRIEIFPTGTLGELFAYCALNLFTLSRCHNMALALVLLQRIEIFPTGTLGELFAYCALNLFTLSRCHS